MKICVIGAGVAGCATAYQLSRNGHEVILVDAAGGPGTGTSFANGAQLSYSYVEPLASPSTFKSIPKMLLDPASPLGLRLRLDPAQWRWIASFLASCMPHRSRQGSLSLLATASLSRQALERWMAHDGLDFGIQRNGKLVLCPDQASYEHQSRQVRLQAGNGVVQEMLDRHECLAREPALSSYPGFVGGVWTPSECAADPYTFCRAQRVACGRCGLQAQRALWWRLTVL